MNGHIFYTAGHTDALNYAAAVLREKGCTLVQQPEEAVTHLLLDVPSLDADGTLKGGGDPAILLSQLPDSVTVCGGNLQHPTFARCKTLDLLKDPLYLAENAQITAHCAVKLAMKELPVILRGCHVLVIGWGRIGKCLATLLKSMGAVVTVAARRDTDRAMLLALGYDACDISSLGYGLLRYRVIFNTVPVAILSSEAMEYSAPDCLKIDLASVRGMAGDDVIHARGLPNKDAPESSGKLIAQAVLRLAAFRKEL